MGDLSVLASGIEGGSALDRDDGGVVAQTSADVGEEVALHVVQECLRGLSVHWAARSASG